MKKCIKILILIIVLTLIVLCILFCRKFNKVNKIIEKMEENSKIDNYYFKNDDLNKKRNNNIVIIEQRFYFNILYYYDFNIKKCYIIDEDNKIYYELDITESDKEILDFPLYYKLTTDYSLKSKIKSVFEWKITDLNKNLYEIVTKNNNKIIFDKTTGYILEIDNMSLENKYYKSSNVLKINTVKDDEMNLPDLTEYTREN